MADITIYTLAEELNMTPSMVSRAFNPDAKIREDKRKLVLETAKKYNFSPNKFASRLSMNTIRIGILISSLFKINTDKMIEGINAAYAGLKDYKIKYDITVINPTEAEFADYERALKKYESYDGLIISGMSSEKYTNIINEFYKKNPNIVQVQAINEEADYLFSSKHNEKTAAYMGAEFLYNCLRKSERKNVILFTGDKESKLHSSAEASFEKACSEFGLKLLESIDMKDSDEVLKNIVPEVFEKYNREIDGIYITSGISIPICEYLEKEKLDVSFVAFDLYEEIKVYLNNGIVSATIEQNVAKQMQNAFEKLLEYIIKGERKNDIIYTDVQLVLKSNMYQFG